MRSVGRKARMSSPIVRRLVVNCMPAPSLSGARKLAQKEKAWKSGRTTKNSSLAEAEGMSWTEPSMSAQKLPCVRSAPLGRPVVPEV